MSATSRVSEPSFFGAAPALEDIIVYIFYNCLNKIINVNNKFFHFFYIFSILFLLYCQLTKKFYKTVFPFKFSNSLAKIENGAGPK